MNVTAQVKLEESMILAFIDPFLVLILLEITLGLRDQGKFDKQDLNRKGSHAGLFLQICKNTSQSHHNHTRDHNSISKFPKH